MGITFYIAMTGCLALIAFAASMLGIGGGTLFTPLQVFFGIDMHEAVATSLVLSATLGFCATFVYRSAGRIDWALALVMGGTAAAGGFTGGYLAAFLSDQTLVIILAASLVIAGAGMLHPGLGIHHHICGGEGRHLWRRQMFEDEYVVNLAIVLPLAFVAGVAAGLVGIGGGVINIPIMVLLSGVPMDIAVATSSPIVGVTALMAFAGHLVSGQPDWPLIIIFSIGVLPGAWLGAHMMLRMDKRMLRIGFGILMFFIAAVIILRQFLPGHN